MHPNVLRTALAAVLAAPLAWGDLTPPMRSAHNKPLLDIKRTLSLPTQTPEKPKIARIQVHHWIDTDKDNHYDEPQETVRVYESPLLRNGLYIEESIPAIGRLSVRVPQHIYWGDKLYGFCRDEFTTDPGAREITVFADFTTPPKKSYEGQPLEVMPLDLEGIKSAFFKKHLRELRGTRYYLVHITRKDKTEYHWCSFPINFDVTGTATNAPAITKSP